MVGRFEFEVSAISLTQRLVEMATNDGGEDLSNWKEMTDKNTGKKFYYNTVTRKTQWTLPEATTVAEQVNAKMVGKLPIIRA